MTWMVGSRGCITPVTVNTSGALNWGCSIFGQPHWHNHPETRETNRTHVFANGVLPAWDPRNSSFLWVVDGSPIISTLHFPSFSHGFQFPTHSGQLLVTTPFSFRGTLGQRRLSGSEHRHAATLSRHQVLSFHANGQARPWFFVGPWWRLLLFGPTRPQPWLNLRVGDGGRESMVY